MAKAAWECADPGIQYDDTITTGTTSPVGPHHREQPLLGVHGTSTTRRATWPRSTCSSSSRGRHLRRRAFVKAVELVITAMDISICFADFPTEAIGDTTRRFRQLGIGYANLGALLMAAGLGYDSDGGRALAASITSAMTGTAYRRSAELAGVVGPYDGTRATPRRTAGSCASTPPRTTPSGP